MSILQQRTIQNVHAPKITELQYNKAKIDMKIKIYKSISITRDFNIMLSVIDK